MLEKDFQKKVISFLKSKGCFVMKLEPGGGIPRGVSDIFFCKEGFYGFIECKKNKTSKFQPLQPEFIEKMDKWSWAKAAYPENWDMLKKELSTIL